MSTLIKSHLHFTLPLRYVKRLMIPILLLGLWQYSSSHNTGYAYAFVPLQQVYEACIGLLQSGELLINTWGSLKKALLGFIFGGTAGLVIGALLAYSKIVNAFISPIFNAIRQVPLLGL